MGAVSRGVDARYPDEVAQYANQAYITSYQSLGEGVWLWTTSARSRQTFDFDGIRVFVYNERKKTFDTVFAESNIRGYYPVEQTGGAFQRLWRRRMGR